MPSYITEKYAGVLTKEDVGRLFDRLTEKLGGNRSEAARQCNLTGKATYDWEKAKYVKMITKEKVLEATLNTDFLKTIEYLLQRSSDRTVDILRTVLSTLYNETMETDSAKQFMTFFAKFETLRRNHRGLVNDKIRDEVADMVWSIRQRTSEFKISCPDRSIDDSSLREWLEALPVIAESYLKGSQEAHAMAKVLDLPSESIDILLQSFEKLRPVELAPRTEGTVFCIKQTQTEILWGKGQGRTMLLKEGNLDTLIQKLVAQKPSCATHTAE